MANVYYKINNNYQHLTFSDIQAAALHHYHTLDEIQSIDFQHNGGFGQNINNLWVNNNNALFYVPHPNSNYIYAKTINDNNLQYDTMPWWHSNIETYQNIIEPTPEGVLLNTNITTAHEYKYNYPIKTGYIDTDIQNYYYSYPLKFTMPNENITVTFQVNIPYFEDETYHNVTNCSITITPDMNIENIIYGSTDIVDDNNMLITSLGIYYNNNTVLGLCIVTKEILDFQIELSNIKIIKQSNNLLTIFQKYTDFYDIFSIPDINIAGGAGPRSISGLVSETESKNYYRSQRWYNLLTWGDSITIFPAMIYGYCSNTSFNKIDCILYLPYEFNSAVVQQFSVLSPNITLNGNVKIWTMGEKLNNNNWYSLITDNTKNYSIIRITNNSLIIQLNITPPSSNIHYYSPVVLYAKDEDNPLTITINNQ